ncbi:hypothetical protein M0R45_001681 [Rubus argutus]|uniref:Aminotransferase-like plant mobile domain-containing protein n=1 Tax=Rubus argutus TaxID=59490 RepID=A0AAW1VFY7_RUBAR
MEKTRNTTQHNCNAQSSLQVRQSAMKLKENTAKSCRRKPNQDKKKGKAVKEKLSRTKISEEANALSADEFETGSQEAEESEEDEYASDDNLESNNPKNLGPGDDPHYGVKRHYPSKPQDETRLELHVDIDCHISQTRLLNKVKGCGNHRLCAEWYMSLPASIKHRIKDAGFGEFVKILKTSNNADRQLLLALAERWWDTTHTFYFDAIGELTMTPTDFNAITGLPVKGRSIKYGMQAFNKKSDIIKWFGKPFWVMLKGNKKVKYNELRRKYSTWKVKTKEQIDQLTRVSILALIGSVLCCDKSDTFYLFYMPSLEVVDDIGKYNWGGAGLACVYKNMDAVSRGRKSSGGLWRMWEVWACEYIIPLALTNPGHVDTWPRANRWLGGKFGKRKFNIDPWAEHEEPPSYVTASKEVTKKRILFHGLAGYAWYLGERVTVQSLGTSTHLAPYEPPGSMMADYEYTEVERTDGIIGWPCERFIDNELDYTSFKEEYIKYHEYPDTETDEEGNCNDLMDVWHQIPMPPGDITLPKCNTESYSLEHFSIEENNRAQWATLDDNVKAERLKTAKKSRFEHEEHEEHEMHNVMEPSVLHKSTDPIYAPKAGKRDNVGRDRDFILESETHGVAVDGQDYVITPETEDHGFAVETEGHKIDDHGFDIQLESPRDDHGFND